MKADICFMNAKAYSMEFEGDCFEAFAVYDGKIVATGNNTEIGALECGEQVDLAGQTVLPGFTDSHLHILAYGKSLEFVNLKGSKSVEEVMERLRRKALVTPKGDWIRGLGFDHQAFSEVRMPDRYDLDAVSIQHPILISRYCLHAHVANSPALSVAGIDRNFRPPTPHSMITDEEGEPTGILWETAATPAIQAIPDPIAAFDAKVNAVRKVCEELVSLGITSAHTVQGKYVDAEEYLNVYQTLERKGQLPVRVYVSFDEYPKPGMQTGFGNEKIRYGFYKMFMDGSLGSRGAALSEPYSDMPDAQGVLTHSQAEVDALIWDAHRQGLQAGIHCIGDRALEIAVTAIENALRKKPAADPRFRLIHALVVSDSLIKRMQKLPVMMDIQPMFVSTNVGWSEDRLGPERSTYAYAWKRLIDAGFVLSASSDAPVEGFDPMKGIYAIVTRQSMDGKPEGGWHPENRVSVYEALCMYTKNGAYASFEESIKGTLSPGKLADFIVLDTDPFHTKAEHLKDISVLKTWVGGHCVYDRGSERCSGKEI
jgi:predicted amidohydrolase YtcJ